MPTWHNPCPWLNSVRIGCYSSCQCSVGCRSHSGMPPWHNPWPTCTCVISVCQGWAGWWTCPYAARAVVITVYSIYTTSMGCGSTSGGGSIAYTPYPGICLLSSPRSRGCTLGCGHYLPTIKGKSIHSDTEPFKVLSQCERRLLVKKPFIQGEIGSHHWFLT